MSQRSRAWPSTGRPRIATAASGRVRNGERLCKEGRTVDISCDRNRRENMKITVKQKDDAPVATEVLATAIVEISDAMKKLNTSGLKRRALVALIHDQSKIGKREIEIVLNNLDSLRADWCTR